MPFLNFTHHPGGREPAVPVNSFITPGQRVSVAEHVGTEHSLVAGVGGFTVPVDSWKDHTLTQIGHLGVSLSNQMHPVSFYPAPATIPPHSDLIGLTNLSLSKLGQEDYTTPLLPFIQSSHKKYNKVSIVLSSHHPFSIVYLKTNHVYDSRVSKS